MEESVKKPKRKQHRACYQCRQDHKKCDGAPWPCQRCVKLGLADTCGDGPPAKRGKTLRAMEELEKRAKGNMFEWKFGASPGLGVGMGGMIGGGVGGGGMGMSGEARRSSEPNMTPHPSMFPDYEDDFRYQTRERDMIHKEAMDDIRSPAQTEQERRRKVSFAPAIEEKIYFQPENQMESPFMTPGGRRMSLPSVSPSIDPLSGNVPDYTLFNERFDSIGVISPSMFSPHVSEIMRIEDMASSSFALQVEDLASSLPELQEELRALPPPDSGGQETEGLEGESGRDIVNVDGDDGGDDDGQGGGGGGDDDGCDDVGGVNGDGNMRMDGEEGGTQINEFRQEGSEYDSLCLLAAQLLHQRLLTAFSGSGLSISNVPSDVEDTSFLLRLAPFTFINNPKPSFVFKMPPVREQISKFAGRDQYQLMAPNREMVSIFGWNMKDFITLLGSVSLNQLICQDDAARFVADLLNASSIEYCDMFETQSIRLLCVIGVTSPFIFTNLKGRIFRCERGIARYVQCEVEDFWQ